MTGNVEIYHTYMIMNIYNVFTNEITRKGECTINRIYVTKMDQSFC